MEYLFGMGFLVSTLLIGMIVVQLWERLMQKISERSVKKRSPAVEVRRVCICPNCRADLYHEVKRVLDKKAHVSLVEGATVTCDRCQTTSVWIPLGDPPELKQYRRRGSKTFISASKAA